mmetsp:Transcript_20315/g.50556  ORF Transcript_20315/g.50556 Transcript_20315/m.50556 type:complete len:259 (-) Transcript_20315:124-900(-)
MTSRLYPSTARLALRHTRCAPSHPPSQQSLQALPSPASLRRLVSVLVLHFHVRSPLLCGHGSLLLGLDHSLVVFQVVRLEVVVRAGLQPLQQLLLDRVLQLGGDVCLRFSPSLSLLLTSRKRHDLRPFLPQQLARPHEELCDLRQTLLTLVNEESRPVRQEAVYLLQSLGVVLVEGDSVPQLRWLVRPLDGLHAQVGRPSFLNHGGVTTVREGARAPVAHASDAVLIPAECLAASLHLVATVPMVDDLPDHFVALHVA